MILRNKQLNRTTEKGFRGTEMTTTTKPGATIKGSRDFFLPLLMAPSDEVMSRLIDN